MAIKTTKHMDIVTINKNPNIGLYALATDNYCLVSKSIKDDELEKLKKILDVPIHKISIAGTELVGVFAVANNNMLLVPEIVYDSELKELDNLGIPYTVIKTHLTALGNNIVTNDESCMVSEEFSAKTKKEIRTALNTDLRPAMIGETTVIGSSVVVGEKGVLVHRDATDQEIEYVVETFKLEADIGTVNMGSPYVGSGIIINKNGYLIGASSGGPEIQRADYALGFLE